MHRTDASGSASGYFQNLASPKTQVTAEWLNDMQEQIARVVELFEPLVKGDYNQLMRAFQALRGVSGSNANGYWWIRPDGAIEQWGLAGGSTNVLVNLPIPFPTRFENLQLTAYASGGNTNATSGIVTKVNQGVRTLASFNVWCSAEDESTDVFVPANVAFDWRAVGR